MRRITLSCLALPFILLGLTHLVAAQNVSIQLTPQGVPIQIPASGGSFNYTIAATNNGATPQQATVWCMVTLPNGNPYGPVLGPVTVTIGASQTLSRLRTQNVPQGAPTGTYAFNAYIGVYPNTIWDSDTFPFEKLSAQPGGTELWVARYNGPANGNDAASFLALDAAGNVYVTGSCFCIGAGIDYATIKYDANGNQVWAACYNGPASSWDQALCVAADTAGNVYVTGWSAGNGTYSRDYATIKYDPDGNQLWVARYNRCLVPEQFDEAFSLALDAAGNVYVTGGSDSIGPGGNDYATIKYDTDGNQIWLALYNGGSWDEAYSLALDAAGNVYVTGASIGSGLNQDYVTIKYDGNGNQLWVARYDGSAGGYDCAKSVAVDSAGNVYVTGFTLTGGGSHPICDYATIKYDADGNLLWVAQYDGPGNVNDEAYSLALDAAGNVCVTGLSTGGGTGTDYATIKYDGNGNQLWVERYNGPGNSDDVAYSLGVDGGGNVYVTGYSYASGTNLDYATIKYDGDGHQLWLVRYNGPANNSDLAYSLAVDGSSNVYVTGQSVGIGTNYDYATIKYSGGNLDNWLPMEATVLGQPPPQEFALHQNYPNPFNASTVLSYQLPVASHVRLEVFDIAGRAVGAHGCAPSPLVDGWRSAGTHELTFDASNLPSGMYVYRIQAGDWMESGKMILLK